MTRPVGDPHPRLVAEELVLQIGQPGRDPDPYLLGHILAEGTNPQAGECSLGNARQAEMHPSGRRGRDHDCRQCDERHAHDEAHVDITTGKPSVDDLLDGDGDDDPPGGRNEGDQQRPREAAPQFWGQAETASHRGSGTHSILDFGLLQRQ